MPILTIDGSEAQSSKPIDPGVFEFQVESVSEAKQGAKALYVTWIFVCQDEPFVGRKVYHNTPVSGKGAGMFFELAGKINGEDYDVDNIESIGEVQGKKFNGQIDRLIITNSTINIIDFKSNESIGCGADKGAFYAED